MSEAVEQQYSKAQVLGLAAGTKVLIKPWLPRDGTNALTLIDGGALPGTKVEILQNERALNQQWLIETGPNGGTLFKNVQSRTYLGTDLKEGPLVSEDLVSGQYKADEWIIFRGLKGWRILLLGSGLYLDYENAGTVPPVPVRLVGPDADVSVAQEWSFEII